MDELRRAKEQRKQKKCCEILSSLVVKCLPNYNLVRDLKILEEFQNFIK